jgi:hypothetical protein
MERVRIFELLLAFGGTLTSRQIVDYLNTSGTTAKRTMAEFKTIGIVNIETEPSEHGEPQKRMTLDNKLEWFLSEEFKDLKSTYRKNFTPLLPEDNIQNCIPDNELVGGHFSYGIGNMMYNQQVLLNSVIPRSSSR